MADWKCPHCGGIIGEINIHPSAAAAAQPPYRLVPFSPTAANPAAAVLPADNTAGPSIGIMGTVQRQRPAPR